MGKWVVIHPFKCTLCFTELQINFEQCFYFRSRHEASSSMRDCGARPVVVGGNAGPLHNTDESIARRLQQEEDDIEALNVARQLEVEEESRMRVRSWPRGVGSLFHILHSDNQF